MRLPSVFIDEYKGHCVLNACKQADIPMLKKYLSPETINFAHPYNYNTPLHCATASVYPKRKQVGFIFNLSKICILKN